MSRNRRTPDGLTPEESRFLDGEMTPQELRSMEHRLRADPERSAQLDAWRSAMDLWRDDTERNARSLTSSEGEFAGDDFAEEMVERILSEGPASERNPLALDQQLSLNEQGRRLVAPTLTPTIARWYATAAVVLIAIGVSGTLLTQPRAGTRGASTPESDMSDVADHFLDLVAQGPEFEPPLSIPHSKKGR